MCAYVCVYVCVCILKHDVGQLHLVVVDPHLFRQSVYVCVRLHVRVKQTAPTRNGSLIKLLIDKFGPRWLRKTNR